MIVGRKTRTLNMYARNSDLSIRYAVEKIKQSPIAPYVENLYLYGSCARKTQNYNSDVDLFLVLSESIDRDMYYDDMLMLKSKVSPTDTTLPEVDLKIEIGNNWMKNPLLYYKNVKKEGIVIWQNR